MKNNQACHGICPHCDILGCHFRKSDAVPIDEVVDVVLDKILGEK